MITHSGIEQVQELILSLAMSFLKPKHSLHKFYMSWYFILLFRDRLSIDPTAYLHFQKISDIDEARWLVQTV